VQANVDKAEVYRRNSLHWSLGSRLAILAVVLALESFALALLVEGGLAAPGVVAYRVHVAQHWGFRFLIAYGVVVFLLNSLGREGTLLSLGSRHEREPIRMRFFAWHTLALIPLAGFSSVLLAGLSTTAFLAVAAGWHVAAALAVLFLAAGLAPLDVWSGALARSRTTLVRAIAPALAAVLAIDASQSLWHPMAGITFRLTEAMLKPFLVDWHVDYAALTLGTSRFSVQIADTCSGLEGVGLMLVFCISWLWLFRKEFYFPRAFVIIPVAVGLVFLLNSVRIVAIVLIGDAGYPRVAIAGFHSQAGWIAFNAAALAVALFAKRSRWLNKSAPNSAAATSEWSPEAVYLLPLLAILACGMIAHALSAGFDLLYPLRLLGALVLLWMGRRHYRAMNWRFGWRAVLTGTAVFVIWVGCDRWLNQPSGVPPDLAALPVGGRVGWILCRAGAAIVTVPIAEELAYRGFLMRRFVSREFERIDYRAAGPLALGASSLAFGLTHGSMWLPGTIAGVAYGWLAAVTNRIGEAAAAHAVTNGLIVVAVLAFQQWQLW
jgi:exosortase E/protease (VPEID-CTERM system)